MAMRANLVEAKETERLNNANVPSQIEFGVRLGKSGWTRDKGMKITMLEVCRDNRCPEGVQCVAAGNAQILFRFQVGARVRNVALNTNKAPNKVVIAGTGKPGMPSNYVVRLNSLSPTPVAGKKTQTKLYTATLIIENAV